jgi:lipid-A-disaccharide synthase
VDLKILVSAGESSGDLYASGLVETLRERLPGVEFFGCAGPRMQRAGVRPVVDASSLSVVGLFEVLTHIPRIYGEFRKLCQAAEQERPRLAILTDSPDFNLRVARRLKRLGIPVVYLVAPQVWAWRKGRLPVMRKLIDRLLCIFPFEEEFFRRNGIQADYIGHPLTRIVKASVSREEFFRKHNLHEGRPLIGVLPGSRPGEIARHLGPLRDAVARIEARREANFMLGTPLGFEAKFGRRVFERPFAGSPIQIVEGETWDLATSADVLLAASGTVTVEAALAGAPMVTYYRVSGLSWTFGRHLVDVPHFSMVNLIAESAVIPELMQNEMTGERLADETFRLLDDSRRRDQMRLDLRRVAARLWREQDPMSLAAGIVLDTLKRNS